MFTRVHAALITGILLTVLDQMDAAVIKALSVSFTDVSTAIGLAQEGDTVIVPPGTANWSSTLSVTKGITLQGATIVTGAGTSAASVGDQTIIVDNLAGSDGNVMSVTINANQNFRLTGFTFRPGSGGSNDVLLSSSGTQPVMKLRVDHCHFTNSSDRCLITWGWVYGVADHNLMNCSGRSQSFYINMPSHSNKTQGHGAWADYPWFGTDKFFFIEDNTVITPGGTTTMGVIDAEYGARFVARHNSFTNAAMGWHGTEGGNRGGRAAEIYNNAFHWPDITPSSMIRSGTALYHDNTWDGKPSNDGTCTILQLFRENAAVAIDCSYGFADGTGPFDQNDTDGKGGYSDTASPFLFDSGMVTSGTTSGGQGTFTDTKKTWTPNQWLGYSVKLIGSPQSPNAVPTGTRIVSNTANSITYIIYTSGDRGPAINFVTGANYEIHRCLAAIDQQGRGKGDLMDGGGMGGGSPPLTNTVSGHKWAHQALEPLMGWNNVYTPTGASYGFGTESAFLKQGRDYYNLGKGLATDGAPSQVTSVYNAALNGGSYNGPYTYPHPLTGPAPPSNLTIVNSP